MDAHVTSSSSYRTSALDVRRLSLFLAVADLGGFTRAAEAVHISQPALSQAIAELEAELGGPLFHRLGRNVTLTDAGSALVGPARSVLRQLDAARQVTAEVTGLARGRLDLSALRTLAADPLPALVGPFLRAHPAVEVRIMSPDDPAELVDHVRTGAAEIGLTDAHYIQSGLLFVPLGPQHLQVVFPPGTPPPAGPLSPRQLAGVPLIVTPPGTSARDLLDDTFGRDGLRATVAVETSQREAIVPLVLAGAAAAIMPEAVAALATKAGAIAVAVEPPLVRNLVVVRRPGVPTPAATAFLAVVDEVARLRDADVDG
jgi:DNA-binding transcriptional LysR family regulator